MSEDGVLAEYLRSALKSSAALVSLPFEAKKTHLTCGLYLVL